MLVTKALDSLPDNFAEFIDEMEPEYRSLYGDRATDQYLSIVEQQLSDVIDHTSVVSFGVYDRRRVVAIGIGQVKGDIGHIAFVHALTGFQNESVASELIRRVVDGLRKRGVIGIVMDSIPLCELPIHQAFESEGFRAVERILMSFDLTRTSADQSPSMSVPWIEDLVEPCCDVLLRAFQEKSEPILYRDMSTQDQIHQTLRHYWAGGFGTVQQSWARIVEVGEMVQAVALGTAISEEVGFIFQIAVDPAEQGRGIGTAVLTDLCSEFARSGMKRVLLGVTVDDRAYRLYRRMGFSDEKEVTVYVWPE